MRTRTLTLAAVAATAALAGLAAPGAAEARGHTCNYTNSPGVVLSVDGYDNSSALCRSFNSGMEGTRVAQHPVRSFCGWQAREMNVRVIVYATTSVRGRLFCKLMTPSIDRADWRRLF